MLVWVLAMVVLVVGIKFFTATRMRDLEKRLNQVKEGLHQKRDALEVAMTHQTEVETEGEGHSERIRIMKELLNDMQIRVTINDVPKPEQMVDSEAPPPII